jgi:HAD superfamily hydrolase (TIGR01509 family)
MKISTPENIDFNSFKTLIFDWGGVIMNIDPQATIKSFKNIGHNSFEKYFETDRDDLFFRFEIGLAQPEEIYQRLRGEIVSEVTTQSIDDAFCAMLSDTPPGRIEILKKLGSRFQLILLSNTNILHTTFYNRFLLEKMNIDFPGLFDRVYYSFDLGMRKPDREIFEYVINDNNLDTATTLFIDDTEVNTNAASLSGLQVFHLTNGHDMEQIFGPWLMLHSISSV